jgi:hypothetical protein
MYLLLMDQQDRRLEIAEETFSNSAIAQRFAPASAVTVDVTSCD